MPEKVNEIYRRIFDIDPLLLNEEHQRIFGSQILQNLLVERGIKSALPRAVTLDSPSSRNSFKHLGDPPPAAVSDALKKAYFYSYRNRTKLDEDDLDDLKPVTMMAKGEYTNDRKGSNYSDHDKAFDKMANTGSPLANRLRIAAIGYRVTISRIPGQGFFGEELCPLTLPPSEANLTKFPENKLAQKIRRTVLRDEDKQPPWFQSICRHITHALERGSHIIVIPEFGLPPNVTSTAVERAISAIGNVFKYTYFLFSGTRHEGIHNRGFVVTRKTEAEDVTTRWWHYKTASARSLGENVTGPQNSRIPSYTFRMPSPLDSKDFLEYRIFVPICYDIFDPTTFINYVIGCADAEGNWHKSIILVPSFNPGQDFVHALRDLSFIAGCPVIYVNGLHGDAKLFLYGIAVSDLMESEPSEAPDGKTENQAMPAPAGKRQPSIEDLLTERRSQLRNEWTITNNEFQELTVLDPPPSLLKSIDARLSFLQHRLRQIKKQRDALKELIRDFADLRRSGALRHLITTEKCPHCPVEHHNNEAYCPNDIVYYNLDPSLLDALELFRENYFYDDGFLPPPFRREGKKHIREMIGELIDEQRRPKRRRRTAPN